MGKLTWEESEAIVAERDGKIDSILASICTQLETVTSDTWKAEIHRLSIDKNSFSHALITRARDGFRFHAMRGEWNGRDPSRLAFSVSWPIEPGTSYSAGFSYIIGHNETDPETTVNWRRPVAAIVKQLLRVIVTDQTETWFQVYNAHNAAVIARENSRDEYHKIVLDAAGLEPCPPNGSGVFGVRTYGSWAHDFELSNHSVGGKVTVDLPSDPEKAAAMVRLLRAAASG